MCKTIHWRLSAAVISVVSVWGGVEATAAEQARVVIDRTSLKASETIVVVPEEYKNFAKQLTEAVRVAVGESPAIKLEKEIELSVWKKYNMLLIGSMCSNKAILRVYQEHRCAVDAFYPGKGGYVIRTSDNPRQVTIRNGAPAGLSQWLADLPATR